MLTIHEIKNANEKAGKFFFSENTVKSWGTRISSYVRENEKDAFFPISDKNFDGTKRVYKVCRFEKLTGGISYYAKNLKSMREAKKTCDYAAKFDGFLMGDVRDSFIAAALFTATDGSDKGNPLDRKYSVDDFTAKARKSMLRIVQRFVADNRELLLACDGEHGYANNHAMIGYDLLLTMQGHGCGFWEADHCTKEQGEQLTKAAKSMGYWCEPFVEAHRGKLHFLP
jgi:hypothetical protein